MAAVMVSFLVQQTINATRKQVISWADHENLIV